MAQWFSSLAQRFKSRLTPHQLVRAKRWVNIVPAWFVRHDLGKLANLYGTDKNGIHFYTQHYQRHFQRMRRRPIRLLEIGIGGYDSPYWGGQSLRMWKSFFPRAQIVGLDVHDKSLLEESRIKTVQGSQDDVACLEKLNREWGPFDIIIDDGSHTNAHVVRSFETLFPLLKTGGIYAVEDIQTAYWDDDSSQPNGPTSMQLLLGLVNGINFEEYPDDAYQPNFYDRNIVGMHFYHNLVFIEKGVNNEGSNRFGSRFWKDVKPVS